MTLIANSLYKILAQKTKWLNNAKPKTIARNIIDTKARITIEDEQVIVKFANRTYNPVIREWVDSLPKLKSPWWNDRILVFQFN